MSEPELEPHGPAGSEGPPPPPPGGDPSSVTGYPLLPLDEDDFGGSAHPPLGPGPAEPAPVDSGKPAVEALDDPESAERVRILAVLAKHGIALGDELRLLPDELSLRHAASQIEAREEIKRPVLETATLFGLRRTDDGWQCELNPLSEREPRILVDPVSLLIRTELLTERNEASLTDNGRKCRVIGQYGRYIFYVPDGEHEIYYRIFDQEFEDFLIDDRNRFVNRLKAEVEEASSVESGGSMRERCEQYLQQQFNSAYSLGELVREARWAADYYEGLQTGEMSEVKAALLTFVDSTEPSDLRSLHDLFQPSIDFMIPEFGGLRQRVVELRAKCLADAGLSEEQAQELRERISSADTIDEIVSILSDSAAIPDAEGVFRRDQLDRAVTVLQAAARTGAITDAQIRQALPNFALLEDQAIDILHGTASILEREKEEARNRIEEERQAERVKEIEMDITARLSSVNSFVELIEVLGSDDLAQAVRYHDYMLGAAASGDIEPGVPHASSQDIINSLLSGLEQDPLAEGLGFEVFDIESVLGRLRRNLSKKLASCLVLDELVDVLAHGIGPESQLEVVVDDQRMTLADLSSKLMAGEIDASGLPDLIAEHYQRVTSDSAFEAIRVKRVGDDGTESLVPCDKSIYERLVARVEAVKSVDGLASVLVGESMPDVYDVGDRSVGSHTVSSVLRSINIKVAAYKKKKILFRPDDAEQQTYLLDDLVVSVGDLLEQLPTIAGIQDKARALVAGSAPEVVGRLEEKQININGFEIILNGAEKATLLSQSTVDGRALVQRDNMDNEMLSIVGQQIDLSGIDNLDSLPREYVERIGMAVIIQSNPDGSRLAVCDPVGNLWTVRAIGSDGTLVETGAIPPARVFKKPEAKAVTAEVAEAGPELTDTEKANARFFVTALKQSIRFEPSQQGLLDRLLDDQTDQIERQAILAELGFLEGARAEQYQAAAALLDTIRRDAAEQIAPENRRRSEVVWNKRLKALAGTISSIRNLGVDRLLVGKSDRLQLTGKIMAGMASSVLTRSALAIVLTGAAGLMAPTVGAISTLSLVLASGAVLSAREISKQQEAWAEREKGWRDELRTGFRDAGNLLKVLMGKDVAMGEQESVEDYEHYLETLQPPEILRRLAEARLILSTQEPEEGAENESTRQDLIERYGRLIKVALSRCGEDGVSGAISSAQEVLDETTYKRMNLTGLKRGTVKAVVGFAVGYGAGSILRSVFHLDLGRASESATPSAAGDEQIPLPPKPQVPAESPTASAFPGVPRMMSSEGQAIGAGAGVGAAGLHFVTNPPEAVGAAETVSGLGGLKPSFITEKATEWVVGGERTGAVSLVDQSIAAHEIRANIAERLDLWDQHADGTGALKGDWVTTKEVLNGHEISVQTLKSPVTLEGGIIVKPGEVKIVNGEFDFSGLNARPDIMKLVADKPVWSGSWADHRLGQISAKLDDVAYVARLTGYSPETLSANDGQLLHHVQAEAKNAFSSYFKEGRPTIKIGESQMVPKPHSTNEFLQSTALRSALRQEVASYARSQGIQIIDTPKVAPTATSEYTGLGGGRATPNKSAGVEYPGWGEKNPPAPYEGSSVPKIAVEQSPTSANLNTAISSVVDDVPAAEVVEPVAAQASSGVDINAERPTATINTDGPTLRVEEPIKVEPVDEPIKVEPLPTPKEPPTPVAQQVQGAVKVQQRVSDLSKFEDIRVDGLDKK